MPAGWRQSCAVWVATGFGLGRVPYAPGTWGSLLGVLIAWLIFPSVGYRSEVGPWPTLSTLFIASLLAYVAIYITERYWQTHDDKKIIIDEVVGQMVVCLWFPPTVLSWALAFAFFRGFDILKPPPIGWVDRWYKRSWATLMDDILAGAAAVCLLRLVLGT